MNQPKHCKDCQTELHGLYCSQCGQKDFDQEPPFYTIYWEWISETIGLNSKIWSTFKQLFLKPGYLSEQYVLGRRTSYLRPVKLLMISLLLSLLFAEKYAITSVSATINFEDHKPKSELGVYSLEECQDNKIKMLKLFTTIHEIPLRQNLASEGKNQAEINETIKEIKHNKLHDCEYVDQTNKHKAYITWGALPILSLLFLLFFRIQNHSFHQHMIHTMHCTSAYNLLSILPVILTYYLGRGEGIVRLAIYMLIMIFIPILYITISSKRFYKTSFFNSLIRTIVVYSLFLVFIGGILMIPQLDL